MRDAWGEDFDRAAFEALAIEAYRSGKFGTAQVRQLLQLETRWDAEKWLAERGVYSNYSLEDLEDDRRTLGVLSTVVERLSTTDFRIDPNLLEAALARDAQRRRNP